jgi:hypothetical protein
MKTFVLMHKGTGNLLEGARVSLFDKNEELIEYSSRATIGLQTFSIDGFLVSNPDVSELCWYVNNHGMEKHFEILGEL